MIEIVLLLVIWCVRHIWKHRTLMAMTLHFKPFDSSNEWLILQTETYKAAMMALVDDAELLDGNEKMIMKFKKGSIVASVDKTHYLYDPRDVTYYDESWMPTDS